MKRLNTFTGSLFYSKISLNMIAKNKINELKGELKKISTQIINVLTDYPEIVLASLYGSSLHGRLRQSSDIDIGIASTKALSFDKLCEIRIRLSNTLKREVDLIDLWRMEGRILVESICGGKILLMKASQVLAHFMKKIVYYSSDFEPLVNSMVKKRLGRYFHVK